MDVYRKESQYIRAIFGEYTDFIEPLSFDEAYLDVTQSTNAKEVPPGSHKRYVSEFFKHGNSLRAQVLHPIKVLAKLLVIGINPMGKWSLSLKNCAFMIILPVRKLFGVGPKMEEKLNALILKHVLICNTIQLDIYFMSLALWDRGFMNWLAELMIAQLTRSVFENQLVLRKLI